MGGSKNSHYQSGANLRGSQTKQSTSTDPSDDCVSQGYDKRTWDERKQQVPKPDIHRNAEVVYLAKPDRNQAKESI